MPADLRARRVTEKESALNPSGMYDGQGQAIDTDYRQAHTRFVMPNPDNFPIFKRLHEPVVPMNRSVYQFDLSGFEEGVRISECPVDNGYGWHTDIGTNRTRPRKRSVTLQLSSADEYEGGELEFMNPAHTAVRKMADRVHGRE